MSLVLVFETRKLAKLYILTILRHKFLFQAICCPFSGSKAAIPRAFLPYRGEVYCSGLLFQSSNDANKNADHVYGIDIVLTTPKLLAPTENRVIWAYHFTVLS